MNINHDYFINKVLTQASDAYEEVKSFFIQILISLKGEDALDYLIKPTRSGTVLYTWLAQDIHKIETCALCRVNYFMSICSLFEELDFRDRVSFVADNDLCSSCFGEHLVINCSYFQRCEYFKDMHHSLLQPHFLDIQHSNEHHCSESGRFNSTEQLLNETQHNTFFTRLESDQTFKSTLDTKSYYQLSCGALSHSYGKN